MLPWLQDNHDTWECGACHAVTADPELRRSHLETSPDYHAYCEACERDYGTLEALEAHLGSCVADTGRIECDFCDAVLREQDFALHCKKDHVLCDQCEAFCPDESALRWHHRKDHPQAAELRIKGQETSPPPNKVNAESSSPDSMQSPTTSLALGDALTNGASLPRRNGIESGDRGSRSRRISGDDPGESKPRPTRNSQGHFYCPMRSCYCTADGIKSLIQHIENRCRSSVTRAEMVTYIVLHPSCRDLLRFVPDMVREEILLLQKTAGALPLCRPARRDEDLDRPSGPPVIVPHFPKAKQLFTCRCRKTFASLEALIQHIVAVPKCNEQHTLQDWESFLCDRIRGVFGFLCR